MNKIFSTLLIILLVLAALPGAGLAQESEPLPETFNWPEKGFLMNYPAGWRETALGAAGFVLLANPDDDPQAIPTAPAVAILDPDEIGMAAGLAAEDAVYTFTVNMLGAAPEGTAPSLFLLGGYDAAHIHSELLDQGMIVDVVGLTPASGLILLYFTTPLDQYETFGPTLEAMVNAIQIGEVEAPAPAAVAPVDPVQVVSVDYETLVVAGLQSLAFTEAQAMLAIPDGHGVVYQAEDGLFCTIRDDGTPTSCIVPPEAAGFADLTSQGGSFWPSSLSPDGQWLAAVGLPLVYLRDTDLTLLHLATGETQALTEDNFDGNYLSVDQAGVTVEVQPVWSPDGTRLAFEQTVFDEVADDGSYRYGDSSIVVLDLTTGNQIGISLPDTDPASVNMGTTVGLDWSPDGETLALMMRHTSLDPAADGLYLIDVANGETTQIASLADLLAGAGLEEVAPGGVVWSPDGSKLLFSLDGLDVSTQYTHNWFWLDLAAGDLHAVWRPEVADGAEIINAQSVTFSPDGSLLLLGIRQPLLDGQTLISLDPNAEYSEGVNYALYVQDLASEEARLLGHLPPVQYALLPVWPVWGPEGDVLIAGYALSLASE